MRTKRGNLTGMIGWIGGVIASLRGNLIGMIGWIGGVIASLRGNLIEKMRLFLIYK